MIASIIRGATSYITALQDFRQHGLGRLFFLSVLASAVLGGLVLLGIYSIYDDIGAWISQIWVWDWGREAFDKIAGALSAITLVFIFFFTFKYLVFILLGPILSLVSQKLERSMLGSVRPSGMNVAQEAIRGVRVNLRNIVRELLLSLLLVIVGVVMPFLSWLVAPGLFVIQAYYAGFGNMDFTLERYYKTQGSIRYVSSNKGFAIGNGAVFLALLSIPVIGMLIAPFLGAVSSAHEVINRHNHEVI